MTTVRVLLDVQITMPDGVALAADIQLPEGAGPYPCLLQRVPYDRGHPAIRDGCLDTVQAVRSGYAVITQDCRGRFGSAGDFTPFDAEARDGADTIEWITRRDWSDGAVGMFGRSYSGALQWSTAALRPPGLRAIAPMLSGADPARDWLGANASFEWGFAVLWVVRHLAPDVLARRGWPINRAAVTAMIDDIACLLAENDGDTRLDQVAQLLPWFADWRDPERRTATFATLSAAAPEPADVAVPALVIAGWFDIFLAGCLRAAEPALAPRALIVGPWPHGGNNPGVFPERDFGVAASADAIGLTDRQLAWFDRWLRPERESVEEPAARWFHLGANEWQTGPAWPPQSGQALDLHLGMAMLRAEPAERGGSRLTFDENDPVPTLGGATFLPGLDVAANAGPRDQRSLLARRDCLAFLGETLSAPLDLAGTVSCRLIIHSAVPAIRFVARLLELSNTGTAMLITDGAAHLDADGTAVDIALSPTSYRVAGGNRLALIVSNTSLPRYRRWVTPVAPAAPRIGHSVIRHGEDAPSLLRLRVLP